ncbi:hypothetical protein BT63DRAFT_446259 [Microthyrium microscopicum]|uniref:RNA ligase/cyclic nucleotide phosphodiesterase n=1 Tax=Microthyrium microscopicum TaxID=703497 RepID=A0A6A6UFH4_9PEZI|nr:hypothetical protein BT63DRAFT_446259 [Microthyrium microscopicum]
MANSNPYDDLLTSTSGDISAIQRFYHAHRTNRNAQQKAKLLDPAFSAFAIDDILRKLTDPIDFPNFEDPRYCLVLWARPTSEVKQLASTIQQKLIAEFPNLWLMPLENMHTTSMEVTHSRTREEIEAIVDKFNHAIPDITDYTSNHRSRLTKPLLGFDSQAIALSFLPAAGEGLKDGRTAEDDSYSYHHLRRDLFGLCDKAGVDVQSRYVLPTAHLTLGRFINGNDFRDSPEGSLNHERVADLVATVESINNWLEAEYWPSDDGGIKPGGQWIVGEGKGLDCREGQVWYGGGRSIHVGRGS